MSSTTKRSIIITALSALIALALGAAAFVFFTTFDLGYKPSARDYVIFDGEKAVTLTDCLGGPEEALERARINVGNADLEIKEDEDATLITVRRYPSVLVACDGEETLVSLKNSTVGEVIDRLGIELSELDTLNYPVETAIEDGMKIKVGRVTVTDRTVEEDIPYDTVYENDPTLQKGKTELKTEGKTGVLTTVYRYTYENGLLVGFEQVSREVTTEKTDLVYSVGTKEAPKPTKKPTVPTPSAQPSKTATAQPAKTQTPAKQPTSTPSTSSSGSKDGVRSVTAKVDTEAKTITASDGTVYSYSKAVSMKATAYSYDSNPAMNVTSSGVPVQVGVVAALPSSLPQGTKVYIVGANGTWEYGFATVGDKPGRDIIDLFMETETQCVNFGVRNATVYIVG